MARRLSELRTVTHKKTSSPKKTTTTEKEQVTTSASVADESSWKRRRRSRWRRRGGKKKKGIRKGRRRKKLSTRARRSYQEKSCTIIQSYRACVESNRFPLRATLTGGHVFFFLLLLSLLADFSSSLSCRAAAALGHDTAPRPMHKFRIGAVQHEKRRNSPDRQTKQQQQISENKLGEPDGQEWKRIRYYSFRLVRGKSNGG